MARGERLGSHAKRVGRCSYTQVSLFLGDAVVGSPVAEKLFELSMVECGDVEEEPGERGIKGSVRDPTGDQDES